jgi:hypothetical protein
MKWIADWGMSIKTEATASAIHDSSSRSLPLMKRATKKRGLAFFRKRPTLVVF